MAKKKNTEPDKAQEYTKEEEKLYEQQIELFLGDYKDEFNLYVYNEIKKTITNKSTESIGYALSEILKLAQTIILFNDQPIKVIQYIRGYVSSLPRLYQYLFIGLSVKIAEKRNDEELKKSKIEFMKKELLETDILNTKYPFTNEMQNYFNYFTGKEGMLIQLVLNSYTRVRGMLKTEEEILKEFIEKHKNEILQELKTSKNTQSGITYFKHKDPTKWDNIKDVHVSLMRNKFIKNDTNSLNDFKNIFTEKQQNNKIEWIGTAGELSCFIKLLILSSPPKVEDMKKKHWDITLKYFEGQTTDNKPFDKHILRGAKPPIDRRKELLDNIVSINF